MKNNRPNVPRNVERQLWAESCGHCMNPSCHRKLILNDGRTSIGDMAHIVPNSEGGQANAGNMILLCKNCHKSNESVNDLQNRNILKRWKTETIQRNRYMFAYKI